MEIDYKQLMHKSIGDIKDMEKEMKSFTNKFWDIIDRQKETVASCLEQEKVEEKWAEDFLKEMEMQHI